MILTALLKASNPLYIATNDVKKKKKENTIFSKLPFLRDVNQEGKSTKADRRLTPPRPPPPRPPPPSHPSSTPPPPLHSRDKESRAKIKYLQRKRINRVYDD